MNMNEYQSRAKTFATGGGLTLEYALLGLAEEAGEACGKAAKFLRRTNSPISDIQHSVDAPRLVAELGDCLWMIANAAAALGYPLEMVAQKNIDKLVERRNAGVICGSGDTTAERIANAQKDASR